MAFSGVCAVSAAYEMNENDEMEDIMHEMNYMYMEDIEDKNTDLIAYINSLTDIGTEIKNMLISLVKNDSHDSYVDIYNICLENDIELPPLH